MTEASPRRRWLSATLWLFLGTTAFALAYGQAPLYYSNQNQYFLHGLAKAGAGFLADDWLANTDDPTPVFTLLVALTYAHLPEYVFHGYYALLLGVYLASMVGIFTHLAGTRDSWRLRLAFAALFFLVHAAALRWLSYRYLGLDYPWYVQAGLASQYILGAMLQPSTFGVLLVLALCLFVHEHPYLAIVSACAAATVHPTYLPASAMLVAAFMLDHLWRGNPREALGGAALAGVCLLPIIIYILLTFRPASAAAFAESQRLLVYERIPHHTLAASWFEETAVFQCAWLAAGLLLAWRSRLLLPAAALTSMGLALTLLQIATENTTLALLFPWRISAILIPLATTLILGRLVLLGARWLDQPLGSSLSAALLAGATGAGCVLLGLGLGYQTADEELPVMNYVRDHAAKGDVYLLPVQIPRDLAQTARPLSSDFKPVAEKKTDTRIIPIGFQRFRLYTGVPVYADFKAIPYKDSDVLEWHRRLQMTQTLYQQIRSAGLEATLPRLRQLGVTHVLLTTKDAVPKAAAQLVFADQYCRVYRLP